MKGQHNEAPHFHAKTKDVCPNSIMELTSRPIQKSPFQYVSHVILTDFFRAVRDLPLLRKSGSTAKNTWRPYSPHLLSPSYSRLSAGWANTVTVMKVERGTFLSAIPSNMIISGLIPFSDPSSPFERPISFLSMRTVKFLKAETCMRSTLLDL